MGENSNWLPMPRFLLRKNAVKSMMRDVSITDKKIVEVGFGAGEMLRWFHAKGAHVTGVDFSPDAINMTNTRLKSHNILSDIDLHKNFDQLSLNSFDFVFAFEVLEHIHDDRKAIDGWLKLLKPGGEMIISVPAHMSKWNESDEWAGHYRRYEKKEFKSLFTQDRCSIIKLWNYGFPLSLVLDKLLGKSKHAEVEQFDETVNKESLSKKSGTERKNNLVYRLISNNVMLYPFFLMQRVFYNRDIGSGYLVHIKKVNE